MTSDRRRCANRANARSSTGPKTATGKSRSAQNAFRHGLNVSVLLDPALTRQVEAIALKIAGAHADPELLEAARRIAEAQVDLSRVRNCRRRMILGMLNDPNYQQSRAPDEKLAAILEETLSQLAAFDRYERRALSRRKIAVRKFDERAWRSKSNQQSERR